MNILPWGTNAWTPEACAQLRQAEQKLTRLFEQSGAREIAMPAFEYLDVFRENIGGTEKIFRLADTGDEVLALRPELTIPAARLFATSLSEYPLPLKLFYIGQVFRQEPKHRGRFREFRQAGCETYGGETFAGDVEMIRLASHALSALSANDAIIEIGHVGIVDSILDRFAINGSRRSEIKRLVMKKDRATLENESAPKELIDLVTSGNPPENSQAAEELKRIQQALTDIPHRIVPEYAAARTIEYYTGVVFEGLLPTMGRPALSGGRYDNLVGKFGQSTPAVGFSLELETLLRR